MHLLLRLRPLPRPAVAALPLPQAADSRAQPFAQGTDAGSGVRPVAESRKQGRWADASDASEGKDEGAQLARRDSRGAEATNRRVAVVVARVVAAFFGEHADFDLDYGNSEADGLEVIVRHAPGQRKSAEVASTAERSALVALRQASVPTCGVRFSA